MSSDAPNTVIAGDKTARPAVLALSIREKAALYAAYMPFLATGGIFVPTTKAYNLGDDVYLLLTLMDDPARLPIAGRVAWITPADSHGNRTPGIGVAFPDDETGQAARNRIETLLAGALKSTRPTHTL
ncbi:PilZ domain-containing protein [Derxia lacustris]|uniref:PilZ domain-containing protein n=1 Tax=Derxia lacustris TaxID=764842 RepID=UPI000A171FCA|nr:PilZ domain-containing protein [Derxia lacustris]